jgi:hypothetical protein
LRDYSKVVSERKQSLSSKNSNNSRDTCIELADE